MNLFMLKRTKNSNTLEESYPGTLNSTTTQMKSHQHTCPSRNLHHHACHFFLLLSSNLTFKMSQSPTITIHSSITWQHFQSNGHTRSNIISIPSDQTISLIGNLSFKPITDHQSTPKSSTSNGEITFSPSAKLNTL